MAMGHDEQEQVQEQVEDHGPNGQVAANGRDFGDTYQADASVVCKHRIVVDLDKKSAAEHSE
jgi:hypothetical protein